MKSSPPAIKASPANTQKISFSLGVVSRIRRGSYDRVRELRFGHA
jgi:hypothetical protein